MENHLRDVTHYTKEYETHHSCTQKRENMFRNTKKGVIPSVKHHRQTSVVDMSCIYSLLHEHVKNVDQVFQNYVHTYVHIL